MKGYKAPRYIYALACPCRDMFTQFETKKEAESDKSFNDHHCQKCGQRLRLLRYKLEGRF